ncbi:hypothetical protein GCM10011508_02860 [Flavobacterium lutivivi]|nr:hypothetical protein GCM10011508_02860 [Flavobacterium lutivivi]
METTKHYVNINYQKLVDLIEQNPQEFVEKLNSTYKGKTVEVVKENNNYKLLWVANNCNYSMFFSEEDNNKSFFELKKTITNTKMIFSSLMGLIVGLTAGKWSPLGFLGYFILIWLGLPLFLKFQAANLTAKYVSKIEKNFLQTINS